MQDISADTAYKNVGDWCLLDRSMRVAPRHHAEVSRRAVIVSRGFLTASGQPQACTYPPCPVYVLTGCLWDAVQLSLMPVWNQQDLLEDSTVASAAVQFKRPAQQSPKAHRPVRHQVGAARRPMLVLRAGKGDMSWREAIGIDSISTETTAYPIAITTTQ
jgi:hypothetical protein